MKKRLYIKLFIRRKYSQIVQSLRTKCENTGSLDRKAGSDRRKISNENQDNNIQYMTLKLNIKQIIQICIKKKHWFNILKRHVFH